MELIISNANATPAPHFTGPGDIGFGKIFTPHMFQMRYAPDCGWHHAEIVPLHPLELHPATSFIHYGASIFEGLKAYRREDGKIFLFRPDMNFKRMNASARRMCMPEVDVEFCVKVLKELIRLDREWVPKWSGTTLYIRPAMFADDPTLGIHVSPTYFFFIILSPVGAYFDSRGLKLWVEKECVRATPGGTGASKTGGNYAGSLLAAERAQHKGYSQVLWLDAQEHRYVEEVGAMNIFFVIKDKVVTPELTDTILNGVTRDSVLRLCERDGIPSTERKVPIEEVLRGLKDGTCTEIFGAGTAAVISPVSYLGYKGGEYLVGDGTPGPIATKLLNTLLDIQFGRKEGPKGWSMSID
jgi:branched-chain amino acid aminotransferase